MLGWPWGVIWPQGSPFVNPTGCHTYCTYLIAYLLTWAYVLYQYAHASAENAITYKKK